MTESERLHAEISKVLENPDNYHKHQLLALLGAALCEMMAAESFKEEFAEKETLRDRFAMEAMAALVVLNEHTQEEIAELAYDQAHEMFVRRAQDRKDDE